jgi:hypothetical protein
MHLGRLFFAGAIVLALAWFALRSPLPAADPRFIQKDFADAGAPLSISAYLEAGHLRERGQAEIAGVAAPLRAATQATPPETVALARAEAVERAAAQLRAAGIGNVMIRFGDVLVARGHRGTGPWRVGLRDPRGQRPGDALAYLLADGDDAIASHGRERVVTVIGTDAPAAAAAAQALHQAGAGGWAALARQRGLEQVLVVEADGSIAATRPLSERLKFLGFRDYGVETGHFGRS